MTAAREKEKRQSDRSANERAHLLAIDGNSADRLVVLEHRNREHRPIPPKLDACNDTRIAFEVGPYRLNVGNVHHLLRGSYSPKRRIRGRSDQFACARLDIRGRGVVNGNSTEAISLADVQRADLRLADAHRIRQ